MEGILEKLSSSSSSGACTTDSNATYVPVPPDVVAFANKMEMHIVQVNAQRFYGPSRHVPKGWEPQTGSEVYVGRIPRLWNERELVPVLEQAGPIFQLRLMMDFSGSNKGYCFVKYHHPVQANLAMEILNGRKLTKGDRPLLVTKSVDNRKLILGGVPTNRSFYTVWKEIAAATPGVVHVQNTWWKPTSYGKGTLTVTYESHRSAAMARKRFLQNPLKMGRCKISVDWAEPES